MRKNLLILLTIALGVEVYAQSALTIPDTRNIATTPSSYEASFEPHFKNGTVIGLPKVDSNPYYTIIGLRGWINDNSGGKAHELAFSNNGEIFFRSGYSPDWESWKKLLVQDANGNVGIGTQSPTSPLYVSGGEPMYSGWNRTMTLKSVYPVLTFNSNDLKWAGIGYDFGSRLTFWVGSDSDNISYGGKAAFSIGNNGESFLTDHMNLKSDNQEIRFYRNSGVYGYVWSSGLGMHFGKGNSDNSITVDNNGNTGIGTNTPQEKLSVNGKIRAKEIKVETANWPDYVFDENYQLPDLKETESFIKINKHLSGIPSAKEVEEHGVSLGEMNAKLLKKVEELTLYVIELKKENELIKGQLPKTIK
ncbi:hypothetical protein [Pseudopedobacter beijingensis]|uniref:Chaperone of endosialidase n=1 Tax=Pseudopedobacter beijingensis TaxID=1207056 RepID=A0ABW4IG08_9SPHI